MTFYLRGKDRMSIVGPSVSLDWQYLEKIGSALSMSSSFCPVLRHTVVSSWHSIYVLPGVCEGLGRPYANRPPLSTEDFQGPETLRDACTLYRTEDFGDGLVSLFAFERILIQLWIPAPLHSQTDLVQTQVN